MKLEEVIPLKEGGAATKEWDTARIHNADIPATIKYFSQISGIPVRDLHAIGTTGKTPSSGDVDLAIDASKYDVDMIHQKIMNALNNEGVMNSNNKIASYAVPIRGKDGKGKVQIDMMFGGNPDWMKFAYHSEGEGSKYKGAVRNILLSSVAAAMNQPGTDYFEFDNDQLVIRAGRTVDLSAGLRRIFQYRPKSKRGEGYLKSMKAIPVEEFKRMFPHVEVHGGQVIIDNPEDVVKALFGSKYKPKDVNTAENVLRIIKKKFDDETQEKIFNIAKARAKNIVGKMKLPPEITPEV